MFHSLTKLSGRHSISQFKTFISNKPQIRLTIVTEHHSHVILGFWADVHQKTGRGGGAEAEGQVFTCQVCFDWKVVDYALFIQAGSCSQHFRHQIILDQCSCFKETTNIWRKKRSIFRLYSQLSNTLVGLRKT